jgi:hypothetical protein
LKNKQRMPFQNMTQEGWMNLGIAAILSFYIILLVRYIAQFDICEILGLDYCAFWSAGRIINDHGYAHIYDLILLQAYQRETFRVQHGFPIQPIAISYLPLFYIPFHLLSLLNVQSSYWIWTVLNLAVLIIYVRFFAKKVVGGSLPGRLLLLFLLPLPVFFNFVEGQVNVLLVIGIGEFIRAALSEKPIKAGLWLGSLLIKPQLLILLLPFLLLQRSFKVLRGFLISFVAVILISLFLIDVNGFGELFNMLFVSAGGGVQSNPWVMMNWRMLGENIGFFTSSTLGLTISIIGSMLTAGVTLVIFRKKIENDDTLFVIAVLGLCAATGAVTWHAHLHASMILIPPLVYLRIKNRINQKIFIAWVFVPVLIEFIGLFVLNFVYLGHLPLIFKQLNTFVYGLRGLIFNLVLLGWAIIQFVQAGKAPPISHSTAAFEE